MRPFDFCPDHPGSSSGVDMESLAKILTGFSLPGSPSQNIKLGLPSRGTHEVKFASCRNRHTGVESDAGRGMNV